MDQDEKAAPEKAVALDNFGTVAAPEEDLVETPEAFLTVVSTALKSAEGVDADLAVILSDHVLTGTQEADVIANAKAAILALAAKRAAPGENQKDG